MSLQSAERQVQDAAASGATEPPSKGTYRSYKKKFHKIKLVFDDAMRDSDRLFKEQQKILDIARRLQEQNEYIRFLPGTLTFLTTYHTSQLMDFLSELNDCPKLLPDRRYNIDATNTASDGAPQVEIGENASPSSKIQAALLALGEVQKERRSGEISQDDFERIEDSILRSEAFVPRKSLAMLDKVPHTVLGSIATLDSEDDLLRGSGTLNDEENYLLNLDIRLGDPSATERNDPSNPPSQLPERTVDKERDLALRNPVSVYNWLRKHQPQVFLQDNEPTSEKASGKAGVARGSKRAGATAKHDDEMYDEDGVPIERGGSARGKRKRDDEPYRPKGGSSRPTKRKREDGQTGKRGKKPSISESAF